MRCRFRGGWLDGDYFDVADSNTTVLVASADHTGKIGKYVQTADGLDVVLQWCGELSDEEAANVVDAPKVATDRGRTLHPARTSGATDNVFFVNQRRTPPSNTPQP